MFKKHPIITFFVLAYLFSWPVWLTSAAQARGMLSFHIPGTFAFVGLAAAAYLTAALSGGRAAVFDLLSRLVRWRANPLWYGVALLITAAIGFLSILLFVVLGGSHQVGQDASLTDAVIYTFTNFFLMWLTEETAWRGFVLPRLQRNQSALNASLILGLLWGLWHIPLFFNPESFQASLNFPGFVLSAIATAILATWIFNHTHGSVLVLGLYHSAVDASILYTGVMSGSPALFWLFIAAQWLAALFVVWVEGPARLARRADLSGATYTPTLQEEATAPVKVTA